MSHAATDEGRAESQIEAFERRFDTAPERWAFHDTTDPATRYTRDRRLRIGIDRLQQLVGSDLSDWSALVTCAGVGGEAGEVPIATTSKPPVGEGGSCQRKSRRSPERARSRPSTSEGTTSPSKTMVVSAGIETQA